MTVAGPSNDYPRLCQRVENRIQALDIEGLVMNKFGGITLTGAFLVLLLLSACGDGMTVPASTPLPTSEPLVEPSKTDRGPAPAAPSVQPSPVPAISPATATWPSAQLAPTFQPTPTGETSGVGFRANLGRTGLFETAGVREFGGLKWRFQVEGAYLPPELRKYNTYPLGAIHSSPAIVDGVAYVGSDDLYLYAVDIDTGQQLWRFLARPDVFQSAGPVQSSPVIAGDLVFFGTIANHLFAVEIDTDLVRWQFKTGNGVRSSPAIAEGSIFFGSWDGNLYSVDIKTGSEKWRFETGDRIWSSPAIAGTTVFIGSDDGNLYAVDKDTGMEKWRFRTGGWVTSTPRRDRWCGLLWKL